MSRSLVVTLALSILIHILLGAYFWSTRQSASAMKHGSIAVDLIQSVSSEQFVDPHNHPGRKAKRQEKKNAASASPPVNQPAGDPNGSAKESDLYIALISKLINARKIYPSSAVEREEEGRVVIGVTLDREGHIVDSKIETGAPFESLNKAALETIKSVGQFPPIPAEVPDPIHLHVPLIFKVDKI